MRVKRYVLDTNIWISYFIKKQENKLANIILNNDLVVFYCDELIIEITRVLSYSHIQKFNIDINDSVDFVKIAATSFAIKYPIKNYIIGDNDDSYLVALALQTNSGFITSGDSHILSQKHELEKTYTKLKIITKTEFEQKFTV